MVGCSLEQPPSHAASSPASYLPKVYLVSDSPWLEFAVQCPLLLSALCVQLRACSGAGWEVWSHSPCCCCVDRFSLFCGRTFCGMISTDALASFAKHTLTQTLTYKPELTGQSQAEVGRACPVWGLVSFCCHGDCGTVVACPCWETGGLPFGHHAGPRELRGEDRAEQSPSSSSCRRLLGPFVVRTACVVVLL